MRRGAGSVDYAKIVLASIVWGSVGLIVRAVPVSSAVVVFFRVFFAALCLAGSFVARRRLDLFNPRGQLPLLLLNGVLLAANWLLFFLAFTLTSIASAVLAAYAAPVFIALLAAVLLGERLRPVTAAALAAAMGGIALMVLSGDQGEVKGLGVLVAVSSGFFYALNVVCNKHLVKKLPADSILFFATGVAALLTAPFLFGQSLGLDGRAWLLLLMLGGVHTALAIAMFTSALRRVPAQVAGVLSYVEPVSAALFAALLLGESPSPRTYVGGALVVAAGLATSLGGRESEGEVEAEKA